MKKILQCLSELNQCSKGKNNCLVKHLNNESLDVLINSVCNVVNTNKKKIRKSQLKALKTHKKTLMYLANPRNSIEKKRKTISTQSGTGFLALISKIAIPLISALL